METNVSHVKNLSIVLDTNIIIDLTKEHYTKKLLQWTLDSYSWD